MKIIYCWLLIFMFNECYSQNTIDNKELLVVLDENISRISFAKIIFFEDELIELSQDSLFRTRLVDRIDAEILTKKSSSYDEQEFFYKMNVFYERISDATISTKNELESQEFIMSLVQDYQEIDFEIDETFVLNQIDASKHSLANGYDEGSINESRFLFICHSPEAFKKALIDNNKEFEWIKSGTFLCNYLRENSIPILIRYHLKQKIILDLKTSLVGEDKIIVNGLMNCNVAVNLFD